jgi:hypothetical protein
MLDEKAIRSGRLMQETASVTALQAAGSVAVQLVDINVAGVSFVASDKLPCSPTELLSMRFTLPGGSRLHFAMISLLPAASQEGSGYRYDAKFVRTDPQTIDHIIQWFESPQVEVAKDAKDVQLH